MRAGLAIVTGVGERLGLDIRSNFDLLRNDRRRRRRRGGGLE